MERGGGAAFSFAGGRGVGFWDPAEEKLGFREGLAEEEGALGCSAAMKAGAGAVLGSLSAAAAAFCLYLFPASRKSILVT